MLQICNYQIYLLRCPISKEIKYIGLTGKSLKNRLVNHINTAVTNKRNWPRLTWIRSLRKKKLKPIIEHYECASCLEDAKQKEIKAISFFSNFSELKNATKGGDTQCYKIPKFVETKNTVKIDCYTLKGKFVKTYISIELAIFYLHKNSKAGSKISSCIRGKRRSAYGYIWRKHKDPLDKFPLPLIKSSYYKKINCYDKKGNFIRTFNTNIEISEFLGLSRSNVRAACTGKQVSLGGYIFRYEGESFYSKRTTKKINGLNVYVYDKNNFFIKKFLSIHACARYFKTTATTIRRKIDKEQEYKGFYFKLSKI